MSRTDTALKTWEDLYEAAAAFKKAECWKYFSNSHIFGVENPRTGEIGYCCILGNGGEMYGLAVYLGPEGLETIISMLTDEKDEDPMFSQHCLMLSFDSRAELYPAELRQIKELGLKFRGAHAWPTFRLYEPGYVPWPIWREEDALFLTVALGQAAEVVEAHRHDPDAILQGDLGTFLTRTSNRDVKHPIWSEVWLEPKLPLEDSDKEQRPLDEIRLTNAKKSLKGIVGEWEIDCFFAPMPIGEGDRPFYPKMCLIVDRQTGQIIQYGLSEKAAASAMLVEKFLETVEKFQVVPKAVLVSRDGVVNDLEPLLAKLDIEAYWTEVLPAVEEAKEGMLQHF
ncbi:DUF7309 domain-containing protein [Paenibacillus ferrarius]|uniref:DUF7309 domain-containing protein n=1 Tax=Paenibacillus ferrarius TaxID=1469647 RepID=UPI003D2A0B62